MVDTDLGLISKDNMRYLYAQGVLNREGGIRYNLKDNNSFRRPVQLYSILLLVVKDVQKATKARDLNVAVAIMRRGDPNYDAVPSITNLGTKLVFESYKEKGNKGDSRKDFSF